MRARTISQALRPAHLPSLDGLRAVSILMVLLSHILHQDPARAEALSTSMVGLLDTGPFGVRVFFVISGFLITTLLIEERTRTGKISLPGFFLRRFFRIFPAYYVYLTAIVLLAALGFVTLGQGDLRAALTYTMNYHLDRSWYLGHMWSLSVEEQFYLLWPALLLLAGLRGGMIFAALAFVAAPLARVIIWIYWPAQRSSIGESFHTIFDALATGCLLAGLRQWLSDSPRYLRFLQSPVILLAPVVALACNGLRGYVSFDYPIGQTITNLAIALSIDRWVRYPGDLVGRALNRQPLVFIGRISYSIYLWQQLFLGKDGWLVQRWPFNLVLIAVAAIASYLCVEQPLQQFYRRHTTKPLVRPKLAHTVTS